MALNLSVRPEVEMMADCLVRLGSCQDDWQEKCESFLNRWRDQYGAGFSLDAGLLLAEGKVGDSSNEKLCVASAILKTLPAFRDVMTFKWHQRTLTMYKASRLSGLQCFKVSAEGQLCSTTSRHKRTQPIDILQDGLDEYNQCYEDFMARLQAQPKKGGGKGGGKGKGGGGKGGGKGGGILRGVIADLFHEPLGSPTGLASWGTEMRPHLPKLLAAIAAVLTNLKSGESFSSLIESPSTFVETKWVLFELHPVQVLAILKLLNYDSEVSTPSLSRELVELGDGEGKTLVLGIASLLLALLGFRARVVGTSGFPFLQEMFEALQVRDLITCSTFAELCEEELAASARTLSEKTAQLLLEGRTTVECTLVSEGGSTGSSTSTNAAAHDGEFPRIVLLDGVSPLLEADSACRLEAILQNEPIANMFSRIYEIHKSLSSSTKLDAKQLLEEVQKTSEYQNLKASLKNSEALVEREVRQMCLDVFAFSSPTYHIDEENGRIGYKEEESDQICYQKVYGYKTAFAYIHEAKEGSFSDCPTALKRGLVWRVPCGHLPYQHIKFGCMLALDGNLSSLSTDEWQILKGYSFDRFSTMPSIFGNSKVDLLDQKNSIEVAQTRELHLDGIKEVVKRLEGKGRAVLTFFDSEASLQEFAFLSTCSNLNILSKSQTMDEQDVATSKAVFGRQSTYTTASFANALKQSHLSKAGWVHVLATYLPASEREEVQLQSCAANCGHAGSYSMMLCEEDLKEQFGLAGELPKTSDSKDAYNQLERLRSKHQEKKRESTQKLRKNFRKQCALTRDFQEALANANDQKAAGLFKEMNAQLEDTTSNHAVFCLDRSGSMWGEKWMALLKSFNSFLYACQLNNYKVSVAVFNTESKVMMRMVNAKQALSTNLESPDGEDSFLAALADAELLLDEGAKDCLAPLLVFMSDGDNHDDCDEAMDRILQRHPTLRFHSVFFGHGDAGRLPAMAKRMKGTHHNAADGIKLREIFTNLAIDPKGQQ